LWCDLVICSDTAVLGQTGARVGACPTVGATQYLPRIVGERIAREMIFLCRTFTGKEAVDVGLANKCVSQDKLLDETMNWVKQINTYSGQTIRQTKKSLNSESDELYASWQHGMELLAHVWGSDECMEGMNAFIEKRKPNFFKFREKNAQIVKDYLTGLDNDDNVKPT
jgi:naphthoate synthase